MNNRRQSLRPSPSNAVTGDSFFNRDQEKKLLIDKVEHGWHVLLTGQRRIGKSSLFREVGRIFEKEKPDEWSVLLVDIQNCDKGEELVARLRDAMHKHPDHKAGVENATAELTGFLGKVKKITAFGFATEFRDGLNPNNWKKAGRRLISSIEACPKRTMLVFDEFPDVVTKLHKKEGKVAVENLLEWLRPEMQASAANRKMSVIFTGSIGLEPILQRLELSNKINTVTVFRLEPWPRATASACMDALAKYRDITFDSDARDYVLDRLAIYIPSHVQRCWDALYNHCKMNELGEINLGVATCVYEDQILKKDSDSMVTHYEERLKETLGDPLYMSARNLLDQMSNGKQLSAEDAKQFARKECEKHGNKPDMSYLLNTLTHDGYLIENNDRWIFQDGLLRQWWFKRQSLR